MADLPHLSVEELNRYARHLAIPSFGQKAQQKLKAARVLVIGAGGLGSPLLLYLAAAGVGHIGIVDFDTIDTTNLQRQVLYTTKDTGRAKAQIAAQKIRALNPHIEVKVYQTAFTRENAAEIAKDYDVLADGTDNFRTRYLTNDVCVLLGKVNVYASIFRFEGQVSVFNYLDADGKRGPNYRDLFPQPPPPGMVPSCAEGGVLGVLPGIIGSMQANEVIKVITGVGEPLSGKLFLFDAAHFSTRILKIRKNPAVKITELIDYEQFCGLPPEKQVKEITVAELQQWQQEQRKFQLIDVREPYEFQMTNIGGLLIPLHKIEEQIAAIDSQHPVVVHCKSGMRSAKAIQRLEALLPKGVFYNLKGGIDAWNKAMTTLDKS